MAKEEPIEVEGKVVEVLPGSRFKIELESGHMIMGTLSGKMRKNNIKVILYDKSKSRNDTIRSISRKNFI